MQGQSIAPAREDKYPAKLAVDETGRRFGRGNVEQQILQLVCGIGPRGCQILFIAFDLHEDQMIHVGFHVGFSSVL
jgi:hypothetical protein